MSNEDKKRTIEKEKKRQAGKRRLQLTESEKKELFSLKPVFQRKTMKELYENAKNIPLTRPKYMSVDITKHHMLSPTEDAC